METLETALARARAGNGQVLGVVAEAGTGKSRLCYEFTERCRAAGLRVIEGRCAPYGKSVPLLPILQVFRHYYGITEQDSDQSAREKLAGRLLLLDEGYREVLPVLFEFFGVPDPDRPAPYIDPELKQRQLFGVLRKLVQHGAEDTVALIEDLHWIDGASAAWLDEWVEAVAGTRFVLIVNFRPEFEAGWLRKSYYQQLALAPLSTAAARELLETLLGPDPSIAGLADAIYARTGGNPFFTEEVVQSLIESGKLQGSAGNYRLTAPVATLDVPATVHVVLAARIDGLAEREKQVLETAAVIGKDFSAPVLTRVLADVAPHAVAATELAVVLRALAQAEFLYEQAVYPVAEYTFKHPLTQQVAYDTLLRERRARVHAAVARATAEVHAEKLDEKAALLAHHWEYAGDAGQAALWHRRAAEWAGLTNPSEGFRHWDRVRSLVRTLPQTEETSRLGATACLGVLRLGWRLGMPMAEAGDVFEEGRRLADAAGDVPALAALQLWVRARSLGWVRGRLCEAQPRGDAPGRSDDRPGFADRATGVPRVRLHSRRSPARRDRVLRDGRAAPAGGSGSRPGVHWLQPIPRDPLCASLDALPNGTSEGVHGGVRTNGAPGTRARGRRGAHVAAARAHRAGHLLRRCGRRPRPCPPGARDGREVGDPAGAFLCSPGSRRRASVERRVG
jgi:adenylate cyclase